MRVVVFGQSGQLARELRRLIPSATCLGRDEVDFTKDPDFDEVLHRVKPDVVVNAAAYTDVDRAEDEPELAFRVNAYAPGALSRACARRGTPFVHVSTDYVFSGAGHEPWKPDSPPAPLSVYGRSKLAGERAVEAAGGHYVILRTAWVFSAHGNNFVRKILDLGRARDTLTVVSDQIGGPTPADDLARCVLRIAELASRGALRGTYHYAGQPDVTRADFARAILSEVGLKTRVTDARSSDFLTRAARPLNSRLDCRSLEKAADIHPPLWAAGLRRVLAELQAAAPQTT